MKKIIILAVLAAFTLTFILLLHSEQENQTAESLFEPETLQGILAFGKKEGEVYQFSSEAPTFLIRIPGVARALFKSLEHTDGYTEGALSLIVIGIDDDASLDQVYQLAYQDAQKVADEGTTVKETGAFEAHGLRGLGLHMTSMEMPKTGVLRLIKVPEHNLIIGLISILGDARPDRDRRGELFAASERLLDALTERVADYVGPQASVDSPQQSAPGAESPQQAATGWGAMGMHEKTDTLEDLFGPLGTVINRVDRDLPERVYAAVTRTQIPDVEVDGEPWAIYMPELVIRAGNGSKMGFVTAPKLLGTIRDLGVVEYLNGMGHGFGSATGLAFSGDITILYGEQSGDVLYARLGFAEAPVLDVLIRDDLLISVVSGDIARPSEDTENLIQRVEGILGENKFK